MSGRRFVNGPGRSCEEVWRLLRIFAAVAVLGVIPGCARSASGTRDASPVAIAVRNTCPIDLEQVSLRGPALSDGQSNWLGTISPVPRGTVQMLGQRSAAFPWPGVVEVVWTDGRRQEYSRKIVMESLLKHATGERVKVLIVEIRPAGQLVVYWQRDAG